MNSVQVTPEKVLLIPAKDSVQFLVFLRQRDVGDHAGIGIHTHREARFIEGVDRMISIGVIEVDLHIGGRADFQMNAVLLQMLNQSWIFYAAYAMTNA